MKKKIKVKKVVTSPTEDHIRDLAKNPRRKNNIVYKGAIQLTPDLFIATDGMQWILREVYEKSATGYNNLLYSGSLKGILKMAVDHMVAVPMEVQELAKKLGDIYELIKLRVPNDFDAYEMFHKEEIE